MLLFHLPMVLGGPAIIRGIFGGGSSFRVGGGPAGRGKVVFSIYFARKFS